MYWLIFYFRLKENKRILFLFKENKEIIKLYVFCIINNLVWLEWMRDFYGGVCYFDRLFAY